MTKCIICDEEIKIDLGGNRLQEPYIDSNTFAILTVVAALTSEVHMLRHAVEGRTTMGKQK
jgi:hypothetical protein